MKRFLMALIRLYQKYISPLKPSASCKFIPCCSNYALEAIGRHGAFRGSLLAVRRILRCNPFSEGGIDTVPLTLPRRRIQPEEI